MLRNLVARENRNRLCWAGIYACRIFAARSNQLKVKDSFMKSAFVRLRVSSAFALCLLSLSAYTAEPEATNAAADGSASQAEAANDSTAVGKDYDWAFTGYVAWMSGDQLGDMLIFKAKLSDNKIWVAALTRRLTTFYKDVDWEVEGQIAKHGGGDADMHHWEFNALTSVRWNRFIWDKYVDTSFATGLGLSYATEKPEFEIREHGATNRLLAYILVELAFSPPSNPKWAGVLRIHHRSSAYGTFEEDIQGASNSLGVGIKYRF